MAAAAPSGLVLVPAGRFLAPRAPLRGADVPAPAPTPAEHAAAAAAAAAQPAKRRKLTAAPRGASEGQALGRAGLEPAAPQLARSAAFLARLRRDVAELLAAFAERLAAVDEAQGGALGLVQTFVVEWRSQGWVQAQFAWGEHAATRAAFWQSVGDAFIQHLAPLQEQLASSEAVESDSLIAAVGAVIGLYVLCGTALDVGASAERLGPQINAAAAAGAGSPAALDDDERAGSAMDDDAGASARELEDDGVVQLWHLEIPSDLHATVLELPDVFKRNSSSSPLLVAELSAVVQALHGELSAPRTVTLAGSRQLFPSDAMLASKTYRPAVRSELPLTDAQRRSIQASARRRQRALQANKTPEPLTPDEAALAAHRAAQLAAAGPPEDEEENTAAFEAPQSAASLFAITPCATSAWRHAREAARVGNVADVDRTSAKFGELLFDLGDGELSFPSQDSDVAPAAGPSQHTLAVPLSRSELVRELVRERLERTASPATAAQSGLRAPRRIGPRVPLPNKRAFQPASQAGLEALHAATAPLAGGTAAYRAAVERTLEGDGYEHGELLPLPQRALRHDVVQTAKERTRKAVDEARRRDGAAAEAAAAASAAAEEAD